MSLFVLEAIILTEMCHQIESMKVVFLFWMCSQRQSRYRPGVAQRVPGS